MQSAGVARTRSRRIGADALTRGYLTAQRRARRTIAHRARAGRARGVPAVLMTFDPPDEVVYPGSHPAQLDHPDLTRGARSRLGHVPGDAVHHHRFIHELLVEHPVEVDVYRTSLFGKKAAGHVYTLPGWRAVCLRWN